MKRKIIAGLVAVGALLALGGCASTPDGATDLGYEDYAQLVVIDGVRCIVATGYRSTAISCDWED